MDPVLGVVQHRVPDQQQQEHGQRHGGDVANVLEADGADQAANEEAADQLGQQA